MFPIIDLVSLYNKRIEVLTEGTEGLPIVILGGMGCSFHEWYDVVDNLSQSNRVIMFHRPGLGMSELGDEIRNTYAVVDELHELLHVIKINEPIILVGHSYGGLCAQHFLNIYPKKVAGIVLVDSTSVNLHQLDELDLPVLNSTSSEEKWLEMCKQSSFLTSEELKVQLKPMLTEKEKKLPLHIQQRLLDFQVNPSMYKAMCSEVIYWKDDARTIKRTQNTSSIPSIIIGRDKEYTIEQGGESGLPEFEIRLLEETWERLVQEQAYITNDSEVIIAGGSSHAIHQDRPDIIIGSIKKVIDKVNKESSRPRENCRP